MMPIDDALTKYPGAVTFTFGDSEPLCNELLSLVRSGKKTATCGALRDFGSGGEPMPVAGRCDIAFRNGLDGQSFTGFHVSVL